MIKFSPERTESKEYNPKELLDEIYSRKLNKLTTLYSWIETFSGIFALGKDSKDDGSNNQNHVSENLVVIDGVLVSNARQGSEFALILGGHLYGDRMVKSLIYGVRASGNGNEELPSERAISIIKDYQRSVEFYVVPESGSVIVSSWLDRKVNGGEDIRHMKGLIDENNLNKCLRLMDSLDAYGGNNSH